MFALLRYRDTTEAVEPLLQAALDTVRRQPGCTQVSLGRSPDDPTAWAMLTLWNDIGALRRGLGSTAAKYALGPLQAFSTGEDVVFETLLQATGTEVQATESGRTDTEADHGPGADR